MNARSSVKWSETTEAHSPLICWRHCGIRKCELHPFQEGREIWRSKLLAWVIKLRPAIGGACASAAASLRFKIIHMRMLHQNKWPLILRRQVYKRQKNCSTSTITVFVCSVCRSHKNWLRTQRWQISDTVRDKDHFWILHTSCQTWFCILARALGTMGPVLQIGLHKVTEGVGLCPWTHHDVAPKIICFFLIDLIGLFRSNCSVESDQITSNATSRSTLSFNEIRSPSWPCRLHVNID